jgi:rhodanese-related sulfurtransferase/thioredoxin-related protein
MLVIILSGSLGAAEAPPPQDSASPSAVRGSSSVQPAQTGLGWLTDLQQAEAQAKSERKSILLFFHGSDWCPPCVEMQREVFASPHFAEFARKGLVLVDVDFPANLKQDKALRQANLALKEKFNLSKESAEGFPTIVVLDDEGHTVFQETGYAAGSSAEVLAKLQRHAGTGASASRSSAFRDLSVEEFAQMAADKHNVILDVRTPGEFNAGHIAAAINLDVNASDFPQKAAALDKSMVFLVHCASGVRSVRACEQLSRLDFPKLYNLPGGFKAWVKAGKPVEK